MVLTWSFIKQIINRATQVGDLERTELWQREREREIRDKDMCACDCAGPTLHLSENPANRTRLCFNCGKLPRSPAAISWTLFVCPFAQALTAFFLF